MKKGMALILVLVMCLSLGACGKSKAVIAAEELIAAIGEVTDQSGEAIQKAEDAVAALSAEEKETVETLAQLTEARKKYDEISAIKPVEELIANIGTVSLESGNAITVARAAYDALASEYKDKVSNYSDLQTAEQAFSDKRVEEVVELIDEIVLEDIVVSDTVQEAISGIYTKYNALSEEEQGKVTNYETLNKAKDTYNEMWVKSLVKIENVKLSKYNYTGELLLDIIWVNKSPKTIKYIYFVVGITNSVGDYFTRNGQKFAAYQQTGPCATNYRKIDDSVWYTGLYPSSSEVGRAVINKIVIEYMDGSEATITEENVRFALS